MLALAFPNINPVMLEIGPFKMHWYGAAYAVAVLAIYKLTKKLAKKFKINITDKNLEDFLLWVVLGIIVGGRLGYVIFYDLTKYLQNPIDIFKTYEGGMSFHGGLFGVIAATYLFAKKHHINYWNFIDLIAVGTPIGLFLGRLANFINGELYGNVSNISWAFIFPGETLPRHPSQLYEAFLEGIVLFAIMLYITYKKNSLAKPSLNSGVFLSSYAVFRMFIELFRQPDSHIGYLYSSITMGHLLSLPLLLLGIYLIFRSLSNPTAKK